ncbi:MAG: creatininase family protein [Candidatus Bilamarchaeaceae archaeon]
MRLIEMNAEELRASASGSGALILSLGSIEDHGVLPLGTDTIIAERIAEGCAGRLGIPSLSFSLSNFSEGREGIFGNIGLDGAASVAVLNALFSRLNALGFSRVVIVCGHDEAFDSAKTASSGVSGTDFLIEKWWDVAWPRVQSVLDSSYDELGPGGEDEGSLMLFFGMGGKKNKADFRNAAEAGSFRGPWVRQMIVGRPECASAEKGKEVFEKSVDAWTERIRSFIKGR